MQLAIGIQRIVLIVGDEQLVNLNGSEFFRHVELLILVVAPGHDAAVFQHSGVMVAAAVELGDLRAEFRHVVFALGGAAPDDNLAILGQRSNGLRGRRNVHRAVLALDFVRDAGEGRVLILVSGVGDGAIGHQRDVLVLGQRDLGNLALELGLDLNVGHVAVAPEIAVAISGNDRGELVAGFQLDNLPVLAALLHGLFHVGAELVLLEARVAPDIDLTVLRKRDDVVRTGSDHGQIRRADFIRHISDVDLFGDAGVTPDVKLTIDVGTDAVGVACSDIRNAGLEHRFRHGHHVAARREVGQGRVLLGQIQHPVLRTDHDEGKDREEHDQARHRQRLMDKVGDHLTHRRLDLLLFLHGQLRTSAQEHPLEPANEEEFFFVFAHDFFLLLTCQRGRADRRGRS